MSIERLIEKLQSYEPKWFQRISWINESIGGVLGTLAVLLLYVLVGLVLGLLHIHIHIHARVLLVLAILGFNLLSIKYEMSWDPWRFSAGHSKLDDIGQRAAGSLLLGWIWCLL